MRTPSDKFSNTPPTIPPLDPDRVTLFEEAGLTVKQLEPLGVEIYGADVRHRLPAPVIEALEVEMANRGFIVFKHQADLSADELVNASKWWGAGEIHSTHGVHPATPGMNRDIFRCSNDNRYGILGVGPQWHNDGSFEAATFSHSAYYMARAPEQGGGTHFAHQGAAFDVLPEDKQAFWERLVSVNSASGVSHPVVHKHPISGRKSVWLHLGMTGAVLERLPEDGVAIDELQQTPASTEQLRLLNEDEMKQLFNDYNDLLNASFEKGYGIRYHYDTGDLLYIDNWALAHRAAPEAHMSAEEQGLRIMDRVTIKARQNLAPHFELPQYINLSGPHPFNRDGVWKAGGVGFRWKDDIPMQN
ncbi:TauD/TfdA family dioxygenase [Halomonas janggokensis]|uniref:TauD/TfdA family dioxygenase n=1 Tax=Vreelandella janggokensis TaxID=370767 RepID=A0ABT4IRB5_9GAMM|nr:TauD/TfdA family dioxygenase [Halomonas janggokensis]MCZ0926205.1 TauD/TfdA family dioxygenase [Halomonas janggokensis]MCZ0931272.1 TauD/TfdA family dioxygenase [Halomonas janggokensis]